jgi:hypothetical protein
MTSGYSDILYDKIYFRRNPCKSLAKRERPQVGSMDVARKYKIYDLKTGQVVALMDADGTLHDTGYAQAIAELKELLRRELVVRDRQLAYGAGDEDEGYELFPEESMCYFGMITLRPGDPEYLRAFLNCLPSISTYEARPVRE